MSKLTDVSPSFFMLFGIQFEISWSLGSPRRSSVFSGFPFTGSKFSVIVRKLGSGAGVAKGQGYLVGLLPIFLVKILFPSDSFFFLEMSTPPRPNPLSNSNEIVCLAITGTSHLLRAFLPNNGCNISATSRSIIFSSKKSSIK